MPGPAGEPDPAMAQALAAQLPARAWQDSWRVRHRGPAAEIAAQAVAGSARPEAAWARAGASGAAAADEAEPPKPVAPTLTPEQREAGRLKALEITAQRKELREQLQAGALTLAQALARDDEAARGMHTQTLLRALPGIGAATTARLLREAGIDPSRRAAALTAGQRERLLDAVAAVHAESATRHGRRVTMPTSYHDEAGPAPSCTDHTASSREPAA